LGKTLKIKTMSEYTPFKMKGFPAHAGVSPAKQKPSVKYDLSKATVDGKHPQTEKNKKYEGMNKGDLFLQGKTRDKEGNVKDIQWAPSPTPPKQDTKKKKSPAKSHKPGHKDQQGPIPKQNEPLRKSEMKGTSVYEGKGTKDPFVTSERITDYEDRAEFARSDAEEAKGKKKKEHQKTAKHLEREADIIRDRTRNQKKPPFKHKKSPNQFIDLTKKLRTKIGNAVGFPGKAG
jgi:hypothetical protein